MIDASECRFCCGEPVRATETSGEGIKTVGMMIDMAFGMYETPPDELRNGIQLRDGNLLAFDNSAEEYVALGIRIGNCPFCGRRLEPAVHEEETE